MEFLTLNQAAPSIDDFFFRSLDDPKQSDALVVCNPSTAICIAPVILHSRKTLEEHIAYIQTHRLKKAMVIAEDIDFLRQCPSLEYLWVIPALSAETFDFSPLYDLPNLRWLRCETVFGPKEDRHAVIDYSCMEHLEILQASGAKGHNHIDALKELKVLYCEQGQPAGPSLQGAFDGAALQKLIVCQSPIRSLDGLEEAPQLHSLDLSYCRRLQDISALSFVGSSLRELSIERCGKIKDFSPLSNLHHLEHLRLVGSNRLSDLHFIRHMPRLQSFVFRMNVSDGDFSMCLNIPHVSIQNRAHYSHKDQDFSK